MSIVTLVKLPDLGCMGPVNDAQKANTTNYRNDGKSRAIKLVLGHYRWVYFHEFHVSEITQNSH
jgi:hypothetical protein